MGGRKKPEHLDSTGLREIIGCARRDARTRVHAIEVGLRGGCGDGVGGGGVAVGGSDGTGELWTGGAAGGALRTRGRPLGGFRRSTGARALGAPRGEPLERGQGAAA